MASTPESSPTLDQDDKHGLTMRFIRAAETACLGVMACCAAAYPIAHIGWLGFKLKRLAPGGCPAIAAMQGPTGEMSTSPQAIAEVLRADSSRVFQALNVDECLMRQRLLEEYGPCGHPPLAKVDSGQWQVHESDVHAAIQGVTPSSPGPDATPYNA